MASRIWNLARVSTLKRSQDASPERQLAALREKAERTGCVVVGESIERASGGKGESQRPELARVLAAARAGRIDAIGVTRLDRLCRSLETLLAVSTELERLGVDLVVLDFDIDTRTPTGKAMFRMLGVMGELMRDLYAEAAQEGKARALARGIHCARPREILQDDAYPLIKAWRKADRNWQQISRYLASRGIRQPARVIKSTGQLRAERNWPPSTLARAYAEWAILQEDQEGPTKSPPASAGAIPAETRDRNPNPSTRPKVPAFG